MNDLHPEDRQRRRSRVSKTLEFLFWIAIAIATAWVLILNTERILPANSF